MPVDPLPKKPLTTSDMLGIAMLMDRRDLVELLYKRWLAEMEEEFGPCWLS